MDLLLARDARLSADGVYRYRLERSLSRDGLTLAVGMVNPSTADASVDDPTIRRVVGFADRMGAQRVIVWNKFAFRATDVKELRTARDPIGPDNDAEIETALREASVHVVAWGPLAKLPPALRGRWRKVAAIAERLGCDLMCWGTAKDGHPRHPLMLAYDTPLVKWTAS